MLGFMAVKLSVSHLLKQSESHEFSFCVSKLVQKSRFCCGKRVELCNHPLHGYTRYVKR